MNFMYDNEHRKFLEEENYLLSKDESEYDMKLYKIRHNLKKSLFNLISDDKIYFTNTRDKINFLSGLLQYQEFVEKKGKLFPQFIFDDFNADKFEKSINYMYSGHSLFETELYYINEIKTEKNNLII